MNFVDTNVLIYFSEESPEKFEKSAAVLEGGGVVSAQVLNEFASVLRSKNKLPWPRISLSLDLVRELVVVAPLTVVIHEIGLKLAARHNFHVYDAMIVAAALETQCDTLYSEDMQHGLVVERRLTIVNPFA